MPRHVAAPALPTARGARDRRTPTGQAVQEPADAAASGDPVAGQAEEGRQQGERREHHHEHDDGDAVIGLALVAVTAAFSIVADYTGPSDAFGGFAVLFAAAADGATFRYRADVWRRQLHQIRSEEREGLARELHDTVAHHVSAIVIQAQAGSTVAATDPRPPSHALSRDRGRGVTHAGRDADHGRRAAPGRGARRYAPQRGIADICRLARPRTEAPAVDVQVGRVARRLCSPP